MSEIETLKAQSKEVSAKSKNWYLLICKYNNSTDWTACEIASSMEGVKIKMSWWQTKGLNIEELKIIEINLDEAI